MNLQYRPVRREERGMFCLLSLLIDVYVLSFLTLVSDGRLPRLQAEKFPDPFCSRAMLICSIIWLGKRMLRVVVLRGSVSRWHEVAPYSVSLICIVWSCFTLSWCRSINTIPAFTPIIWRGLMASTHVVICRWGLLSLYGSFRWKRYQKHRRE